MQKSPSRLLWAIAILGCGISAWVNNTATTALLLPLASPPTASDRARLLVAILLVTSYAPSLGGIATPVGTAPNLIGLRLLEAVHRTSPIVRRVVRAVRPARDPRHRDDGRLPPVAGRRRGAYACRRPRRKVGGRGRSPERTLIVVFAIVILLWITPGILAATPLKSAASPPAQRAAARAGGAVLAALALFVLPSLGARGPRILDPGVLQRVDWGTLLLLGGGLSLGAMMFESGLARALGEGIFHVMPVPGTFGVVLASTIMAVLVSEMTSNTASASLVVPVVHGARPRRPRGSDGSRARRDGRLLLSGFMLPVSTPPNALVYGTGRVRMREMVLYGALIDRLRRRDQCRCG